MTRPWTDVEEAVLAVRTAYEDLLEKRTKKNVKAFNDAVNQRADALRAHWTEADGYQVGNDEPSLARVLQRYYAETLTVHTVKRSLT